MTCISLLLNNIKLIKYNPFKYDYEPQKGLEDDETGIISIVTKICMKYLNKCHNNKNNNNNNNKSNNNHNNNKLLFHNNSKNRVTNTNTNTATSNLLSSSYNYRISQLKHDNSSYMSINRINHFKESINFKTTVINHTNPTTTTIIPKQQQQQQQLLLPLSDLPTTSEYDEESNNIPLTPSSQRALQTAACYGKSNRSMKTSVFSTVMDDESRGSLSKSESTMVVLGMAYSSSQQFIQPLPLPQQQQSLLTGESNSLSPPSQSKRYVILNNNNNNNRVVHLPGTCSSDSCY